MKTNKSPEDKEVTPSKKKLTQARLPFKLISDVSPKPSPPQTRKRKLSVPETEPATKVGKISKENNVSKDLVVISDDESKDAPKPQKEDATPNPFVKLVDTARKKRLQKSKAQKKTKSKAKKLANGSAEHTVVNSDADDVEMVEVDVIIHEENDNVEIETTTELIDKNSSVVSNENESLQNKNNETSQKIPEEAEETKTDSLDLKEKETTIETSEIVCLDDSNQSSDMKPTETELNNVIEKDKKTQSPTTKIKQTKIESPVTPKRSARNIAKAEEQSKLNTSSSSKLDESVCSNPSTPNQNKSLSTTNSQDESMTESKANLTPKQLNKRLESAKKKEEKEKERIEREKKRQQEKEDRVKQRQEKEEQRKREREEKEEAKRKEREEKEEQRKKEKEEKEKQKEMERKARELKEEMKRKEKEDKEEQRRKEKEAREEERRKKQEALELEKQEQELKKKKAAEAFVNFFVPKQKVEKDNTVGPVSNNYMLSSFTIKSDMRLAPTVRVDLSDEQREALDKCMVEQELSSEELYLNCLKKGSTKPLSNGKTWPLSDKDDEDVMIVEDELPPIDVAGEIITCEPASREKLRPKLLSFHENRRPPYWGTWRKTSTNVKPRRPFGQDEKQLDYEVDSDDDWEEEQEGESLDGSVCGSDDEGDARGDDYEVDNEVFVPHGYLSDEEATMDEDDVLNLSPETQKARLKYLEDEFESELKKPTEKLKPRLYGLLWETKEGGKPDKCVDALWNYFEKFAMIINDPTPLLQPSNEPEEGEKKKVKKKKAAEGEEHSPKTDKKKKAKTENKDNKKVEPKKIVQNQPGINTFLTKVKST